MNNQKQYTLDNNTVITPGELARELRCAVPTARSRLNNSSDPAIVYRKMGARRVKKYKTKGYLLTDNTTYTARQLALKGDLPIEVVRCRLSSGWRDLAKITQAVQFQDHDKLAKNKKPSPTQRIYNSKPINDPMSQLWMKQL